MFKIKTINQQLHEERIRNNKNEAIQEKNKADIDYIAMMCDVELEEFEEDADNE